MSSNDNKRYYWLKLNKDFFQQHKIKVLKALPNGRLYALIYLELLAESTSHNGELRFSELIPYDVVTLAAVIDEDKDNVEKAIQTFVNLELVEILEDKTIYMNEIQKMIGSETGDAKRKREYREKLKVDNVPKLSTKCPLEYRDKSIDIRNKNIDINNNTHAPKHKYGQYNNVLLTDDEYSKLKDEYSNVNDLIKYLDEYIEMKGYKAKSHYLCIKKWVVDAVKERRIKQPIRPTYDEMDF